jgi:ribonuclease HI
MAWMMTLIRWVVTGFLVSRGVSSSSLRPNKAVRHLLQFDGGARGNPGLGGAGAVILSGDGEENLKEVWSGYWYLGTCTNNQAEYTGLIKGLQKGLEMELPSLHVEGDSELVIKQLLGSYKCKSENLIPLHEMASKLIARYPRDPGALTFNHIPRAKNGRADELSNIAMDSKESSDGSSESLIA